MLTAAVGGQSPGSAKSFVPGRLWDGKTPDFRGIWQVRDTAYVNIEGHAAERGIAASKSIVVDPPDGKIPYKPDAVLARPTSPRRCRFFRVPATLRSSTRRITRSASSTPTPARTLTTPSGEWATPGTAGRATRSWLMSW